MSVYMVVKPPDHGTVLFYRRVGITDLLVTRATAVAA